MDTECIILIKKKERRKETSSCQAQTLIFPMKTVHNKTINLLANSRSRVQQTCVFVPVHIWFLPNLPKNTFCCSLLLLFLLKKQLLFFRISFLLKCDGFMFIFFRFSSLFAFSLSISFALIPLTFNKMLCANEVNELEWGSKRLEIPNRFRSRFLRLLPLRDEIVQVHLI